jgi:hypothetical protein
MMREIVDTFEHQYRLVYTPEILADGHLHPITVQAYRTLADGTRKRLTVMTKDGWRAPRTEPFDTGD